MKTAIFFSLVLTTLNLSAAEVMIKGAELVNTKGAQARVLIKHAGILNDNPRIEIKDKMLNISIPNSGLAGKISKKSNGTSVSATMTGEETVTVNVALPYSLAGKEADVAITLKEGSIDVSYPRLEVSKKTVVQQEPTRAPAITDKVITAETAANNAEAEKLDENYLSTLVKNQEKLAEEKHPEVVVKAKKETQDDTDRVNLTQASTAKTAPVAQNISANTENAGKSNFSVAGYVGKFIAFLAIMIAGFYGVLTLFKKGIIKKGKLGFLHSTKLVEVLSTTHIAPKRSLMMVKAHKQVFLISSSEAGIQFLSEVQDVAGLIKNGEEEITGSNFDTNLYSANKNEKQFKLKEEVVHNTYGDDYEMDSLDDMLNDNVPTKGGKSATNALKSIEKSPVQDQVRFSDQIKTKVKNLKQL